MAGAHDTEIPATRRGDEIGGVAQALDRFKGLFEADARRAEEELKRAAETQATVETLEGDDMIEVIAFDSSPVRYVNMGPARYRSRIDGELARIQPGGGTEITFRAQPHGTFKFLFNGIVKAGMRE